MRTLKTVVVPATAETTKQVVDKTLCDLCGQEIDVRGYDVDEATVSHEFGVQYPEGGDIKSVEFDVCGICFTTKIVPWMQSQGATPRTEEREW